MKCQNPPYHVTKISPGIVCLEANGLCIYYDNENITLGMDRPDPISEESVSIIELLKSHPFPDLTSRKHLSRLTLNVTSSCNLRCSYCYAEYGKYGSNSKDLDIDEFLDVLERISYYYHTIDRIQFFGGEPLLAVNKIRAAVSFFQGAVAAKVITRMPKFGIVTNGTLLHKNHVISFLKDNNFNVTVSIDGGREITNSLRPKFLKRSSETYDQVEHGIKCAIGAGIAISTEGTYTVLHQKLGIKPIDVVDYVHDSFGIRSVHLAPAAYSHWGDQRPTEELAVNDFFHAAYTSGIRLCNNDGAMLELALGVATQISKKQRVQGYCPAFTTQLSIDAAGYVYPCFMSMSASETNIGHILHDVWPTEKSLNINSKYITQMSRGRFGARHSIWFDSLVTGCAAADFLANQSYGDDADLSVHEAIVAGTILGIAQGAGGNSHITKERTSNDSIGS